MDDEHEDKRFDQGNTQGVSLVMAPNPTTEFNRIKKRIAGTDVETSSAKLIMMSMGEATRRTVMDDRR